MSLLQVMHTAKYTKVEPSYKTVILTSLSLMLSFYWTNVEPVDQVKSNLS